MRIHPFQGHAGAWVTAAFAALLALLVLGAPSPGAQAAPFLLVLWALAMVGLAMAVDRGPRGGPRGRVR